ncbi:ImmA/IrrE family metallo-endopeptidase [Paramagnetospirillum magneticum]|uniref:ImmA/IrrE family metallo-endopeptidase n=1 Tax=Paramagnetospirillum magneticum TaxID=84159 RepID=UPI0013052F4E|nr:ImmA/IrrE family metallo-endopeptidase [Paramagnetospirillum magneticum]
MYEIGNDAADLFGMGSSGMPPDEALEQLEEIVARLGGDIIRLGFAELTAQEMRVGSIEIHSEEEFDIYLLDEVGMGPIAARETLAHELGHYILHHPLSDDGTLRANHMGEGPSQQAENEATWFAEALLLPDAALRDAAQKTNAAKVLARIFCVSEATVRNRARALDVKVS